MDNIKERLAKVDWQKINGEIHDRGYVLIERILTTGECNELKANYQSDKIYRKKVIMERYRFGRGEYKYFNYPLPELIRKIREGVYPHLAMIANRWMDELKTNIHYPGSYPEFLKQCQAGNQDKATVLILKYGAGGHNTLHQDLYGEIYFPIQVVLMLSEPDADYTGGEFVLMEQIPRAQSKAIVLKPKKGDLLVFTTHTRPVKGSKGYYRVNMKHGVSEILNGERYSLGIIFHDALS